MVRSASHPEDWLWGDRRRLAGRANKGGMNPQTAADRNRSRTPLESLIPRLPSLGGSLPKVFEWMAGTVFADKGFRLN